MDEDACGRQVPEVAGVDLVERGEMRGIGDDRLRFARTCYITWPAISASPSPTLSLPEGTPFSRMTAAR